MKKIILFLMLISALNADISKTQLNPDNAVKIGDVGDTVSIQLLGTDVYITHGTCGTDRALAFKVPRFEIISLGTLTKEVCAFTTNKISFIKIQKD